MNFLVKASLWPIFRRQQLCIAGCASGATAKPFGGRYIFKRQDFRQTVYTVQVQVLLYLSKELRPLSLANPPAKAMFKTLRGEIQNVTVV